MAKKRTPMTPEQKAAKAARERERYQSARKAGFSPDEARSIKKTLEKSPDILAEPTEALIDLMGMVTGAADWLLGIQPDTKKKEPKRGKKAEPGRRTSPKTSKAPKERRTSQRAPRPKRDYGDFDSFARANPQMKANELIRQFRQQGGSIGNEKAKERVRDVRGVEKEKGKVTRFRYYSNEDKPLFGEKNRHLIKDRYMYLVQFEVELEDAADTLTDWMYIASNTPLNMRQIREHTRDMWADGFVDGKEKYNAINIIVESIELIHAVDTTL